MRRTLLLALTLFPSAFLAQQAPARPAITGVAFLRVYSSHPEEAQDFYGKTLGLLASGAPRATPNGFDVYPVNSLQWIEVIPHPSPRPDCMLAAVGFTTRNAAALERYLHAHNIPIETPLHDGEFAVRDPEGNLVVFIQSALSAPIASSPAGALEKRIAATPPSPNAASRRIIHVGFAVHDRAKEDAFWRDILGFQPYWHGGPVAGEDYYQSQHVPDGTDWLEYMLHSSPTPTLKENGSQDHAALGVAHIQDALKALEANGCVTDVCRAIRVGNDGKIQLNLFDPDSTRMEFMEFQPVLKPRSSPILGPPPGPVESR
jgi:catechol 2,3-dioxygenase-like lactoylglutathione lyase family enzyme